MNFFHHEHGQGVRKELLRVWLPHLPGHMFLCWQTAAMYLQALYMHKTTQDRD